MFHEHQRSKEQGWKKAVLREHLGQTFQQQTERKREFIDER